jgi:hypothetical protein
MLLDFEGRAALQARRRRYLRVDGLLFQELFHAGILVGFRALNYIFRLLASTSEMLKIQQKSQYKVHHTWQNTTYQFSVKMMIEKHIHTCLKTQQN